MGRVLRTGPLSPSFSSNSIAVASSLECKRERRKKRHCEAKLQNVYGRMGRCTQQGGFVFVLCFSPVHSRRRRFFFVFVLLHPPHFSAVLCTQPHAHTSFPATSSRILLLSLLTPFPSQDLLLSFLSFGRRGSSWDDAEFEIEESGERRRAVAAKRARR